VLPESAQKKQRPLRLGADHGTRTRNPRITSAVRYQLRQVGLLPRKFSVTEQWLTESKKGDLAGFWRAPAVLLSRMYLSCLGRYQGLRTINSLVLLPAATTRQMSKGSLRVEFNVLSMIGGIMKKIAVAIILSLGISLAGTVPVQAAEQNSPRDTDTPTGIPSNFDIDGIAYVEFPTNPDMHYFAIDVKGPIESDQFNDGNGSWAAVHIDSNSDRSPDYRLVTTAETLFENYGSTASLEKLESGQWVTVEGCAALFYSDLENQAEWMAFTMPYSCLNLPETFAFDGYMDYIAGDDQYYDYYPNDEGEYFSVRHSFGKTPAVPVSKDRPRATGVMGFKVASPSQAPSALETLSPKILKSVVTIFCEQGLGSGWSAQVELKPAHKAAGYNSFIVTNHHVIEDCIGSGIVTLTMNNGANHVGRIVSWDASNDLAGIVTTAKIPGLQWRGESPKQGWWVGVLGAPRGISGYLTTGLISIVSADNSELGTTSPVNPGNSGGPVFDRVGRVIGTVSWKLLESEGLAFAKTTPLLCLNIIDCESASAVWTQSPVTANKKYPNCAALNKIFPGGVARSSAVKNKGKQSKVRPFASLTAYNANKLLDRDKDGIACEK
jgi:hypothetical protein